eukprot:10845760-Ditylum_brightwellii.AAC.1
MMNEKCYNDLARVLVCAMWRFDNQNYFNMRNEWIGMNNPKAPKKYAQSVKLLAVVMMWVKYVGIV